MCFQIKICHKYGRFKRASLKREDLIHSLSSQHPRVVLRDDIVHLLYQIHTLKRDMTTALLEKANSEEIISEYLLSWIIAYEVHQPYSHIMPIIGNGFTIQQEQHALQVG